MLYLLFSKQIEVLLFFLFCYMDSKNTGGSNANNAIFPNILTSV